MSESQEHDTEFEELVDDAARAWLRQNGGAVTPHPEVEELISYQEQELSGEEAARVEQHVGQCARCQEELTALQLFDQAESEPTSAVANGDEFAHKQGWSAFVEERERLREDSKKPPPPYWPMALAATLFFALLGLGVWIASHQPNVGRTPYIVDLSPDGTRALRQVERPERIEMPPSADALVLRLNVGDQTAYDTYRIVLGKSSGEEILARDAPVRDPQGRFGVMIEATLLEPETYRLVLLGARDENTVEIATYSFQILRSEASQP